MNILFTCAGRRNYLLQYFKNAIGNQGNIIAADVQRTAPAMAIADKAIVVPVVYSENYNEIILDICKKEKVNALISLNDLELPVLAAIKNEFYKIGVSLVVSDDEVIDTCFDKWKTVEFTKAVGIDTPKTYLNLESALDAIKNGELDFPLVIKPRWGSASIGIEFPESMEELELSFKLLQKKLFRSMLATISKTDAENAILIQEKIDGTEYGLDIFNDLEGNNLSVYVKEKLAMRAGETDKAVLRNHPAIEKIGEKIGQNLKHIANLDCDIFEKDGKYYLLEMNPRFGGGYPFSQMSGANFPAAIYGFLKNEPLQKEWFTKNYDQTFAKCEILIPVE